MSAKNAQAKMNRYQNFIEDNSLLIEENNTVIRLAVTKTVDENDHLLLDTGKHIIYTMFEEYGPFVRADSIRREGDEIVVVVNYYGRFRSTYKSDIEDFRYIDFEKEVLRNLYG